MLRNTLCAVVVLMLAATSVPAAATDSLKSGTPEMKSMGALAFGPEGIIFIGDPRGAAIFAVATDDTKPGDAKGKLEIKDINEKLASLLGIESDKIKINDLAVNPLSTNVYLTANRGLGADAPSVLLRIDRAGKVSEVNLKDVKFARVTLPNASDKQRTEAITCMAHLEGKLYVSGLSNEDFASTLRVIPFPFKEADKGTGVEIYHGAHGKLETHAPVRTFTALDIKGEAHLMAAYQCTPLVKFPVKDLAPGGKVKGTTVAELGNGNRPLDMIVYEKDGKEFLLLTNSKRGVMKITTEGLDKAEPITAKTGIKGQKYETIKGVDGVEQMAKLDGKNAVILVRSGTALHLQTMELP